jgi:hypothetical protein
MIPRGVIPSMIRTDAIQRVRDAPAQHRRDMQRDFRNYGTTAIGRAARTVGTPLLRAGGAAGGVAGGALSAGFDKVRDVAVAAGESVTGFAKALLPVAAGTAAAELGINGLSAAFGHLKDSVALATDFESTRLGFEILLKSGDARELMADIRQYAATTPFNNRESTDASRQLLAYGFAADQMMPTLQMLGDVSAAVSDRLPIGDAAYLYGTLRSQGQAYAVDVRQFSGRGVSINEELAAVFGKSTRARGAN